jgi:CheY-like chemotaxis protein
MTGLELIERIRGDDSLEKVPAILLTARDFSIVDEEKKKFGIVEVFNKPFSPKELREKIDEILFPKE